jgi:tetraacyldisaccharide 4'-kinase
MPRKDSPGLRHWVSSIEAVMSDDIAANRILAALLEGIAGFYGTAVRMRVAMFRHRRGMSHRLPCKVVSVGNIVLGGTGKTPMSIYTARLIRRAGYRVVVLSRGYKGGAERKGGVVSDGQALQMTPSVAGDEPYLMARRLLPFGIPVMVGRDRVRSGGLAVRQFGAEVIVLDDGFQHLRLQRDLDIVLLDALKPFGNGHLFPRGTLREPLSSLARADTCLLTRCPRAIIEKGVGHKFTNDHGVGADHLERPLFAAAHTPFIAECLTAANPESGSTGCRMKAAPAHPVYAFSGLARNDTFQTTLHEMGFNLRGSECFGDHHRYTRKDLHSIARRADRLGARWMVTTEKDRVKIDSAWIGKIPLLVIGVRMDLGPQAPAFERFVTGRLNPPYRRIL